jgi:hypothetical protein
MQVMEIKFLPWYMYLGGGDKYIQNFGWKAWGEETTQKT